MPTKFIDNELVCIHPCMQTDHTIYQGSMYAERTISGKYDLSGEMMNFLAGLDRGQVDWKTDTAKRCLKIVSRKGCYLEPLLTPLGFPSPAGEEAILDAKIIQARIMIFHNVHGTRPGTDMDEIITFGNIPMYSLRLLQLLWDLAPAGRKPLDDNGMPPVPYLWRIETTTVDGENYMLMSSVRQNIHIRRAVDVLVKFGLADLVNLPKPEGNAGKGRAPVGFHISDNGIRFFTKYLEEYDPTTRYRVRMNEPAPEWFGGVKDVNEEDPPDEVDGENLRELFG